MSAGIIGVPLGSYLSQILKRKCSYIDPLICTFGLLVSTPFLFLAMISRTKLTLFFCLFIGQIFLNLNWPINADIVLVSIIYLYWYLFFSISFIFGLITMLAGVGGLTLGAILSQALRKRFPRVDPLICAAGLIISAPLILWCTFLVKKHTVGTYLLLFFGQVALNLNWAIVADILLVRYMSFIHIICLLSPFLFVFLLFFIFVYFLYCSPRKICLFT